MTSEAFLVPSLWFAAAAHSLSAAGHLRCPRSFHSFKERLQQETQQQARGKRLECVDRGRIQSMQVRVEGERVRCKSPEPSSRLLRHSHKMSAVCCSRHSAAGLQNGPAVCRVFVDCGGADGHDPGTGLESI